MNTNEEMALSPRQERVLIIPGLDCPLPPTSAGVEVMVPGPAHHNSLFDPSQKDAMTRQTMSRVQQDHSSIEIPTLCPYEVDEVLETESLPDDDCLSKKMAIRPSPKDLKTCILTNYSDRTPEMDIETMEEITRSSKLHYKQETQWY